MKRLGQLLLYDKRNVSTEKEGTRQVRSKTAMKGLCEHYKPENSRRRTIFSTTFEVQHYSRFGHDVPCFHQNRAKHTLWAYEPTLRHGLPLFFSHVVGENSQICSVVGEFCSLACLMSSFRCKGQCSRSQQLGIYPSDSLQCTGISSPDVLHV
jgi:hypothetical protein